MDTLARGLHEPIHDVQRSVLDLHEDLANVEARYTRCWR